MTIHALDIHEMEKRQNFNKQGKRTFGSVPSLHASKAGPSEDLQGGGQDVGRRGIRITVPALPLRRQLAPLTYSGDPNCVP